MTTRRDAANELADELGVARPEKKTRRAAPDIPSEGMPPPTTERDALGRLHMEWPEHKLRVRADHILRVRGGIQAQVTLSRNGRSPVAPFRLNVHSISTRKLIVTDLRRHFGGLDIAGLVEHICREVAEYNESSDAVTAATFKPAPEPEWLVWPVVKEGVVNVLFGDGGSGKTMFWVAVCVSLAAGASIIPGIRVKEALPILYADFETGPDDIIRAAHMFGEGAGLLPEAWSERFIYRRFSGNLESNIDAMQADIGRFGVRLAVLDSLIACASGDPNDAETARIFFASASALPGCSVVGLTHISKDSKKKDSPLGSVMYRNLPRVVWMSQMDAGDNAVGFFPNKVNTTGPRPQEFFLTLDESDGGLTYRSVSEDEAPGLTGKLSAAKQIFSVLQHGALHLTEIYAVLPHLSEGTIRMALHRKTKAPRFINLPNDRWGHVTKDDRDESLPESLQGARAHAEITVTKRGVAKATPPPPTVTEDSLERSSSSTVDHKDEPPVKEKKTSHSQKGIDFSKYDSGVN